MLNDFFRDSAQVIESLTEFEQLCEVIAERIENVHSRGNSILVAGNGGSCSDSFHFAGELSCTYDRATRKLIAQYVFRLTRLQSLRGVMISILLHFMNVRFKLSGDKETF